MTRPTHIPQIDALRGIAALLVAFVFHQYFLSGDFRAGPLSDLPVLGWLHRYGWTMVDLFFVISGFIMCHVYVGEGRKAPDAWRFVQARFARLYPLHLVTLLATAVVLSFGVPAGYDYVAPDARHFGLNVLMLQRSSLADGMSYNIPAWSIAVEIYCYAAFYLIARFAPRWLPWLAPIIVAGAVLAAMPEGALSRHVARGFCGFFVGVLVWRWGRFVPTWLLPLPLVAPLWFLDDVTVVNKGCFLSLTLFPGCLLLALRTRLLVGPVFAWLGTRSYAIYMVHAPIFWAASLLIFDGREVTAKAARAELVVCFAAILIAAHFSYRYLELPARRWLRGQFDKRAEPVLAPA